MGIALICRPSFLQFLVEKCLVSSTSWSSESGTLPGASARNWCATTGIACDNYVKLTFLWLFVKLFFPKDIDFFTHKYRLIFRILQLFNVTSPPFAKTAGGG
jgi:hypothetical protein